MPRYSLRTLLVMVTLTAVCLASHRLYQFWYARNYPQYNLYSLLGADVHNGDNWQDVARHFKSAVKLDASNDPNVEKVWKPRGWIIRHDDEIWHFQHSSRHGVLLQFREGRLVNSPSSDFADLQALAQMNRTPVPPFLLRRGIWPYCALLLVVASCVLAAIDRKKANP